MPLKSLLLDPIIIKTIIPYLIAMKILIDLKFAKENMKITMLDWKLLIDFALLWILIGP